MRFYLTCMLFLCCLGVSARQSGKISITIPRTTLDTAFRLLETKTGWHISFESSRVKHLNVAARTFRDMTPEAVLTSLLAGTHLSFRKSGMNVLIIPRPPAKTLSGFVSDAGSGERLPGVTLAAPDFQQGTVTNNFGFYSLSLPADSLRLQVGYMGYRRLDTVLFLRDDAHLNLMLEPVTQQLHEITVKGTAAESIEESSQMSRITLPLGVVGSTPRILGEKDLFKTLQLLPGVKQGTEGTSALLVRGGTPDQNLILLDGAPMYNPMHLLGVFSTFNTAALKDVTLYKGAFPARFGGRLSSIVDITTKDGNMQQMHGEAGIGLLAASLSVEGPIKKDRTSFIVSARRSYPDLAATFFVKRNDKGLEKFKSYFYDVNAKIHHRISDRDQLYFSLYSGRDQLHIRTRDIPDKEEQKDDYSVNNTNVSWGNHIASFRWNHVFSSRLFSNAMLIGSRYQFKVKNSLEEMYNGSYFSDRLDLHTGIEDYGGRMDFDFRPKPSHTIRFGTSAMYRVFSPGVMRQRQEGSGVGVLDSTNANERVRGAEFDLYAEDDWELTRRLKVNAGLHWSGFAVQGRFYNSLQPRLSARYMLPGNWALKASYSRMTQFIHLLANNTISLPTDLWVPATKYIRPQQADQYAVGVAKNLFGGKYEFSAEAYYKSMRNVIEYKDGMGYITSIRDNQWEQSIAVGKGSAYGLELLLKKPTGRLTGWIGYTLGWSYRQLDGVSMGKRFPYKYDRRHDLHILAAYKLRKNIELTASWTYQSAAPLTVSVGQYMSIYGSNLQWISQVSGRNNVRLLPYHRLDLGVNFTKVKKNGMIRTWNISILNAYNQFNPFFATEAAWRGDERRPGKVTMQLSNLMPFMPSVSYQLKW
ncbi:TonB-dependent receptor domain-containing protein [Chitinophaga caseinilytica]|uniref:TonB-dependent receptor domain-containing protein n=1 Tax=Chitinophaga caseinilytica TaxID=2267521 RepID=UPI003C2E6B8F